MWEPQTKLNRAMLVTILYRLAGSPSVTGSNPFTDVSSSRYYYNAVRWAYKNGITKGTTSTTFSPNAVVTRTQAVVMMYRFANKYSYNLPRSSETLSKYSDNNLISGEARAAWLWGIQTGVVNGYHFTTYDMLKPSEDLTRIQMAKLSNSLQCLAGVWSS